MIGEDVTPNLKTIKAIPHTIDDAPELIEVRGEIYFPRSGFVELNEQRASEGLSTFANPRNATAGHGPQPRRRGDRLAPAVDVELRDRRRAAGSSSRAIRRSSSGCASAASASTTTSPTHEDVDDVVERCLWWEERRESLDFEIDGVVVKVDQRRLWRELGVTGREPRWAVAWKFPPITATTTLNRIVWNVGRTGRLLPFAMLEPVHVGGVTVSTATLHNEEDLAKKDVREGDEVVVTRAGDVIPQVIAPLIQRRKGKRLRKAKPPKKCPICDTPTVKPEDSVWTICPNRRGCPGQNFQLVKHFRGAMDIEGLGEKNVYRFLDEGLITDPASIYDLTAEQIAELEGFGETSAKALIARDRALEAEPVRPRPLRARPARDRLRQRERDRRALRLDRRAARGRAPRRSPRSRGSARSWPSRCARSSPTRRSSS